MNVEFDDSFDDNFRSLNLEMKEVGRKSDFYVINDYTFLFPFALKIKKDLTMKLR